MPIQLDKLDTILRMLQDNMKNTEVLPESDLLVKPEAQEQKAPEAVRPKRCQHVDCKVKLALSDFACQCKGFYCMRHRHAETHNCSFDYKNRSHTILEKQLVKTVGAKIDRI